MKHLGVASFVAIVLFGLGFFVPVTRLQHTCVICRLIRSESVYGLIPVPRYHETACSEWYRDHVEPSHEHIWERHACMHVTDLYGLSRGRVCSGGRPIWALPPSTQLAVYQHFPHPLDAKSLFADLTLKKAGSDRLEGDSLSRSDLIVEALLTWQIAGFPGTWEAWWARSRANPPETAAP